MLNLQFSPSKFGYREIVNFTYYYKTNYEYAIFLMNGYYNYLFIFKNRCYIVGKKKEDFVFIQ